MWKSVTKKFFYEFYEEAENVPTNGSTQIVTISFKLLDQFLEAICLAISEFFLRCTTVSWYEGPEPPLSVILE